jgi:putative ABC transport system substrate-binding protein
VKRRAFITLFGGAAAAWPVTARAQRLSVPVIGFLDATTAADTVYRVSPFRDGLKESGFIDGHNVAIEFRWAELAADLAQRQVAVIVGQNTAMHAARAATSIEMVACRFSLVERSPRFLAGQPHSRGDRVAHRT